MYNVISTLVVTLIYKWWLQWTLVEIYCTKQNSDQYENCNEEEPSNLLAQFCLVQFGNVEPMLLSLLNNFGKRPHFKFLQKHLANIHLIVDFTSLYKLLMIRQLMSLPDSFKRPESCKMKLNEMKYILFTKIYINLQQFQVIPENKT